MRGRGHIPVSTSIIMTNKDKYRQLCYTEKNIPIFIRDWWLDITCGNENWDVLLIEEKGKILATLPFYTPHKGIISMPPFTQHMGPWFPSVTDDTKYTTLLGKRQVVCKQFIEQLHIYPHFLQNFSYRITDWLPFYWAGYQQSTRYTYLLENIRNHELLLENMSPNIRRNITKATNKFQITIKKGIPVDEFLHVQSMTFKRQHLSLKDNRNQLKELIETSRKRNQGELWGGYDTEGRLHAAAFIVWQDSSAYYLAGGGNPDLRESGAHSLILWECIRYVSQYTDLFDFEGSMLPGVERFFREFGAKQTPYFTITKGNLSLLYRAWLKLTRIVKNKASKI